MQVDVKVPAPAATRVRLHGERAGASTVVEAWCDEAGWWHASLADLNEGDLWWWEVDGVQPLLDPSAMQMRVVDGVPYNVVRSGWPRGAQLGHHHDQPVIYELHVRGFAGTLAGVRRRLPYLADLGVQVIELMPVHPFDAGDNYWGYMPLVWGAVHEPYGDADAPTELVELCAAAHERNIEVWLDVVFNHTGEGNSTLPTRSLRGLPGIEWYRHRADGSPTDDSGCGNDTNPAEPHVERLVMEALDRYADLGVDGFRFDLATLLRRDGGGLVRRITEWASRRGIRLVAEAWDLGAYEVGHDGWPVDWLQWNDRFRDDVRGFVRGEPGKVPALRQRMSASPELFGERTDRSVNFVTAHDGLTMYDLTIVTDDHHHSWDCGDELRPRMLRNHLALLLLADGPAMFVMGDEFGRTQQGHDNPYDVDGPLTRVDWLHLDEFADLHSFTRDLVALRRRNRRAPREWFAVAGGRADEGVESRSVGWRSDDLWVVANMWWEPLPISVPPDDEWQLALETAPQSWGAVAPRSVIVWERRR